MIPVLMRPARQNISGQPENSELWPLSRPKRKRPRVRGAFSPGIDSGGITTKAASMSHATIELHSASTNVASHQQPRNCVLGRITSRPPAFNPFTCPNCQALYQIVKVEASPETDDREIICRACRYPLVAREGKLVLKYFLLRKGGGVARLTRRRIGPHRPVLRQSWRCHLQVDRWHR
jgi:hypothetical protein